MIQGKNISLRAMEPDDVDILFDWENDPLIWQVSNTYIPFSKHFLQQFIANSNNDLFADRQLRLMIVSRKSKTCIGTLDFFEFDPMHRRVGLGILVSEKYRKNGFASEAVLIASQYAFEILNIHQIFVHVTTDNPASIKLFSNSGFVQTGIKKDWILSNNVWKDVCFMQHIHNNNKR